MASLAGLSFAWPLICCAVLYGPAILIGSLTGDSYHYLAIARKAMQSHIYTYDGVHVTNGFHPLWEYMIRGMFFWLNIQTHESQAIAVMLLALGVATAGVILASAAVIRITNQFFLGLLMVPGLFYLAIGVHSRVLWAWAALDGMESALSLFFGGLLFFVLSRYFGVAAEEREPEVVYRAVGLVLPLLILSRLDDFFIIPALLLALLPLNITLYKKLWAALWVVVPSAAVIAAYLAYNKITVGAAMPLSGSTKSGFVGFLFAYQALAIHFPPIIELKVLLTKKPGDALVLFGNSFRFVEVAYPLVLAGLGALAIWKHRTRRPDFYVFFGICVYMVLKLGYNLVNVHPWHQAAWYYLLISLCLSVLGAVALQTPWQKLAGVPVAQPGIAIVYVALMFLSASQFYSAIAFQSNGYPEHLFWERRNDVRQHLVSGGVKGFINEDDGISAFLLDMPNMHGFAFATDVDAQRAFKEGRMLSLAYSRGINAITGFGYMNTNDPPKTQTEIRDYLSNSLAAELMRSEIDRFDFSLAYYDPVLKLPFISFKPKS